MVFRTYSLTNQGSRSNNEDYCVCEDGIWVLADGLGGHDCGEVASKTAAEEAVRLWKSGGKSLDDEALNTLIQNVNGIILEKQQEDKRCASMRTTLVMAVTDGSKLKFTNVGDSRLYYFRNNKIIRQTRDHSVSAAAARMGDISYSEIRFNEDRNILLKVIGNSGELKLKEAPELIEVVPGDAFLLCSDGFWEYVYEQEMEIDLIKAKTPSEWMDYMAKRILLRTENKNNDNFTAICVMIEE